MFFNLHKRAPIVLLAGKTACLKISHVALFDGKVIPMEISKYCFVLSGFKNGDHQTYLVDKIQKLGGIFLTAFHRTCTHVICGKLTRSEKFLTGCATGRWILTPQFIEDSYACKHWLKEEDYEWNEILLPPNSSQVLRDLYSAPRRNRLRVQWQNGGLFQSWTVGLLIKNEELKAVYKRILVLGGAKMYTTRVPVMNPKEFQKNVTHVIVDAENVPTLKNLLKQKIVCIYCDYIRNYILQEKIPDPRDFQVGKYLPNSDSYYKLQTSNIQNENHPLIDANSIKKEDHKEFFQRIFRAPSSSQKRARKTLCKDSPKLTRGPLDRYVRHALKTCKEEKTEKCVKIKKHHLNNSTNTQSNIQHDGVYNFFKKLPCVNSFVSTDISVSDTNQKRIESHDDSSDFIVISQSQTEISQSKDVASSKINKRVGSDPEVSTLSKHVHSPISFNFVTSPISETNTSIMLKNYCIISVKRARLFLQTIQREAATKSLVHVGKQQKEDNSLELPERFLIFFETYIEEDMWPTAVNFLELYLSSCYYPPQKIVHHLITKLSTCDDISFGKRICELLRRLLDLHPPSSYAKRAWYLHIIEDGHSFGAWNLITKVISSCLEHRDHVMSKTQSVTLICNRFLLVFLKELLETDFSFFLSESSNLTQDMSIDNRQPLIVHIIWKLSERRHLTVNAACFQLMHFFVSSIVQEVNFDVIQSLQRLATMMIECLQVSCVSINFTGANLAIAKLASIINESELDGDSLKFLLNTIQISWIRMVLTQHLLDSFGVPVIKNDPTKNQPLCLQKIVNHYMKMYPRKEKTLTKKMNSFELSKMSSVKRKKTSHWRNRKGETHLHLACMQNDVPRLRELLAEPGIVVNVQDNAGWTPLHEACNRGHLECVKELLEYHPLNFDYINTARLPGHTGIDLQVKGINGIIPLHDAVLNNHLEVVELLLKHGGNGLLNIQTNSGENALKLAKTEKMKSLLQSYESQPLLREDQFHNSSDIKKYLNLITHLLSSFFEVHYLDKIAVSSSVQKENLGSADQILDFHSHISAFRQFISLISDGKNQPEFDLHFLPILIKAQRIAEFY